MSVKPSCGKLLYHMTAIENIPSILENGIMSRKSLLSKRKSFCDIADQDIMYKRKNSDVDLTNFVPFHFFPKTPFEEEICRRYDPIDLAIVTIFRPSQAKSSYYKVVPAHPLSGDKPPILSYQDGIDSIEWDVLDDYASPYENKKYDYDDSYNRTALMAECLVPYKVESRNIAYIFVRTKSAYLSLMDVLKNKHQSTESLWKKIEVNWGMFPSSYTPDQEYETEYEYD